MHIFAIIILFIIATTYPATEAQAGKYSNCLKCHKPSSISRDLRSTTKLLMRQALPRAASEVASQAARGAKSASDNTADALRILLQETADDDFINKPSVYAIIPDEETSYRKIYGVHDSVSVDPDELKGYEEDVFGLALTFRTKLYRPSDSDKGNKLIDYISDTKDTNIIIIGHNENGMLKLPSGDSIALQEVDDACTKHERNCIFISCNSDSWV